MNRDFADALGLCRRAGFISWGHDAALNSIMKGSAELCIMTSDASERLKKEFIRASEYGGRKLEMFFLSDTMDEMRNVIGVRTAVITVNDKGFANLLRKRYNEHIGEDKV